MAQTTNKDGDSLVTIPLEEYRELLQTKLFMNILEAWGVDNWEGYGEARSEYRDKLEKSD